MTASAPATFARVLRHELTVDRARWARMISTTGCATFIATVLLVYRVPLPAYGAYVAVMASQRDRVTSITLSIGALAAAMLAIAFSILLYVFDMDEPALRIPAMALVMFAAMYLSRAPKIGPVLFLTGFILVVTQTLVDQIPDPETLTHLLLWLALVVSVPCIVVPLVEAMAGRKPATLLADGMAERAAHAAGLFSATAAPAPTISVRELAVQAARLGTAATHRLAAVLQLDQLAGVVAVERIRAPWPNLARRIRLAAGAPGQSDGQECLPSAADDALLYRATVQLADDLEHPERADQPSLSPEAGQTAHLQGLRFAFKATLAAMICYIVYSGLDWTGIRTSIITCFFVALGSTGETLHKLSLRITGALIGGLLATLAIVFLFPVMDDIGGFIVLFASVTLLCVWVATASPLIAYAGLQMTFAFYLGVLQDTGPTDDLTVVRDRLVGIVLGNVVMSVVFMTVWPISTLASARAVLARVAHRQARWLAAGHAPPASEVIANAADLEEAGRMTALSFFDLSAPSSPSARPLPALAKVVAWSSAWLCSSPGQAATTSSIQLDGLAAQLAGSAGSEVSRRRDAHDSRAPEALTTALRDLTREVSHAS